VLSHAENRDSIRDSVTAGADTIEHGEDLDEELCGEMVRRGTILVPTLELLTTWFTEFMPAHGEVQHVRPEVFLHRDVDEAIDPAAGARYAQAVFDNFRMARELGVKIALGSDTVYSPLTPHGEYSARELKAMVRGGMTPLEAITAATSVGAQALGMAHRIGTVEPGKAADLLVVTKDPTASADVLYDAGNLRWIICNGRLAVEEGRRPVQRPRRRPDPRARAGRWGTAPAARDLAARGDVDIVFPVHATRQAGTTRRRRPS